MTYKVSYRADRGGWRWWHPDGPYRFGGVYCDVAAEQNVRNATPEEIVVIRRIENAADKNITAPQAVARFKELAANAPLI